MKPLIIGIAGGTGSGKSTVARKVAEQLPGSSVAFLEMDAYYRDFRHLTLTQLHDVNWDHPDAFDVELLTEHMTALSRGEAVEMPDPTGHEGAWQDARVGAGTVSHDSATDALAVR